MNQRITIREGDHTRSRSKLDGVVLTILNKALQGHSKAQTMLIALLRSIGMTAETPKPTATEPITAHDVDIIADFFRRQGPSMENAAAPEHAVNNRQNSPPGKGTKP